MSKLSVVITAHNSAHEIEDAIHSVSFADEIIVVDNQSSDKTSELAKKLGAKVFAHINEPSNLNKSKNFGFTKAEGPWILSLDTDERIDPDLQEQIREIVETNSDEASGYFIPRKNIIFGKRIEHGLWYPDHQLRLFKKGKGRFEEIHNHEMLQVDGSTQKLTGHITHFNYHSISQYIQKIDKQYSDNEADVFIKKGGQIFWYDALRFPIQDFLTNYFVRGSFKDGLHGLVLSILQAFYMFVVFAKIWEKQGFQAEDISIDDTRKEINRAGKQLFYWFNHTKAENAPLLKKLYFKLQNKIL